jgi:hypothetical protein
VWHLIHERHAEDHDHLVPCRLKGDLPAGVQTAHLSRRTMKGMVPSGLIARYSLANTRGGNGSIFSS